MPSLILTKQEALEVLDGRDVIKNDIIEHTRWSVLHEITFKRNDKLYQTTYAVGATEYQDETPWQYEDTIECYEVQPKFTTTYVKVP